LSAENKEEKQFRAEKKETPGMNIPGFLFKLKISGCMPCTALDKATADLIAHSGRLSHCRFRILPIRERTGMSIPPTAKRRRLEYHPYFYERDVIRFI
jgi:hypothetical protein